MKKKIWKRVFTSVLVLVFVAALVPAVFAEGESEKININTATVEQLTKLKKIGEKYAQRIIEYREKNGPFEKPEDITKVKGIGPKIFELNKDLIVEK